MNALSKNMSNDWMNGPLPGNEKKAEARRRQRANKRPEPGPIQMLNELASLPSSPGNTALIILYVLLLVIIVGIFAWMFGTAFASI